MVHSHYPATQVDTDTWNQEFAHEDFQAHVNSDLLCVHTILTRASYASFYTTRT